MSTAVHEFKTPEEAQAVIDRATGKVDEDEMREAARFLRDERNRVSAEKARRRKEHELEKRRKRLAPFEAGMRAFAKLSPEERTLINALAAEMKQTFKGLSMNAGSLPLGAIDALERVLVIERARLKGCERELEVLTS